MEIMMTPDARLVLGLSGATVVGALACMKRRFSFPTRVTLAGISAVTTVGAVLDRAGLFSLERSTIPTDSGDSTDSDDAIVKLVTDAGYDSIVDGANHDGGQAITEAIFPAGVDMVRGMLNSQAFLAVREQDTIAWYIPEQRQGHQLKAGQEPMLLSESEFTALLRGE